LFLLIFIKLFENPHKISAKIGKNNHVIVILYVKINLKESLQMPKKITIILLILYIFCPSFWLKAQENVNKSSRDIALADDDNVPRKRLALVIGNADYQKARKLSNPANDANAMAETLKSLDFEVISGTNLSLREMAEKNREFGDKLKTLGKSGIGLFYYAGHGVQVNGRNYLIPVEADIPREDEIDFAAFNLDQVIRKMVTANSSLNIILLDACRNNPFAQSWTRDTNEGGLAQITAPAGTFIAYATAPDRTASDGNGKNGLFTGELLKYIKNPNIKIEDVFKLVTNSVERLSNGKQVPWTSSSLRGDFYFKIFSDAVSNIPKTENKDTEEPVIKTKDPTAVERDAWLTIAKSVNPADFRAFLAEFPDGANSEKAKIRLEQLVWESIKNDQDKASFEAYLKEFPAGVNAPIARLKLRQLAGGVISERPRDSTNNTVSENKRAEQNNTVKTNPVESVNNDKTEVEKKPEVVEKTATEKKNSTVTSESGKPKVNPIIKKTYTVKEKPLPNKIGTVRTNEIGMKFAWIPAGSFLMGSETGDEDEQNVHRVTFTRAFEMGIYEVTQGQWEQVMETTVSQQRDKVNPDWPLRGVGENFPMYYVSWDEAQEFVKRLNSLKDGYLYRLPTEAEWEYAARAGTTEDYAGELDSMAWYKTNSGSETHPVGQKQPNAWGLFDMHGNVWEWVGDWYRNYLKRDSINPAGPPDGASRVVRGGGWDGIAKSLRSSKRNYNEEQDRFYFLGFRVVRIRK
jgi:formylglycine-generating enzyme required for sulfatase activity